MKIRNYKPEDYEELKKLLEICELFDKSYDKKEKFDNKKPKGSIIICEEDNKIIGCVIFTYDGWDSSIYRLCVHPHYRRKNLGTRLLKEAEKRLKKLRADVCQLGFKINEKDKEKFYKKMGYYGRFGPYIWMEKKLK